MDTEKLRELVRKWRDESNRRAESAREAENVNPEDAGWNNGIAAGMDGCADDLEALLSAQPPKAEDEAPDGSWLWCKLMDFCRKRHMPPAEYNDLFAIVAEAHALNTATPTAAADAISEEAVIALVAGPYMYHHKMDDHAMREGKAFDRCRELTIQNIRTYFATRKAIDAARRQEVGREHS